MTVVGSNICAVISWNVEVEARVYPICAQNGFVCVPLGLVRTVVLHHAPDEASECSVHFTKKTGAETPVMNYFFLELFLLWFLFFLLLLLFRCFDIYSIITRERERIGAGNTGPRDGQRGVRVELSDGAAPLQSARLHGHIARERRRKAYRQKNDAGHCLEQIGLTEVASSFA